jgi:hypothetical protein
VRLVCKLSGDAGLSSRSPGPIPSSPTSVRVYPFSFFSLCVHYTTAIRPPPSSNVTLNPYPAPLHTTSQTYAAPLARNKPSHSTKGYLPYSIAQPLFSHRPPPPLRTTESTQSLLLVLQQASWRRCLGLGLKLLLRGG